MSLINLIENSKVFVISKKQCSNCVLLHELLLQKQIIYENIEIESYMDSFDDNDFVLDNVDELKKKWSITSYPMFFINNIYIGDYNTISKMNIFDEFNEILIDNDVDFSYCEEVF